MVVTALVAALSPPASAWTRSVDLKTTTKYTLRGPDFVSSVGDVNGDDKSDILVAECAANDFAGASWVLFGPFDLGGIDVSQPDEMASRGFRIDGDRSRDESLDGDLACNVAGGGDVNGDGLDDLLIGAPTAGNNGRSSSGSVYVVFGKATTETVKLQDFNNNEQGSQGFRVDGASRRDFAGEFNNLAGLGDVNGDRLSDIAIGAPFAASVYVVFGKADSIPVDLLTFELGTGGTRGYRVDTPMPEENTQLSVGAGRDVNGDSIPDVLVGVTTDDGPAGAYVVFGKADPLSVDLRNLGTRGYRIVPKGRDKSAGASLAGLGDVNGDGLGDVIVGAPSLFEYKMVDGVKKVTSFGSAFVVFGQRTSEPVRLGTLDGQGYQIVGARRTAPGDSTGEEVAAAGDVNGDGRPDALVSASSASHNGRLVSGSVYVIFGKRSTERIELRSVAKHGFRIDGPRRLAQAGNDVDGAGNVIGSPLDDVLVGSFGKRRGRVFVVPGRR